MMKVGDLTGFPACIPLKPVRSSPIANHAYPSTGYQDDETERLQLLLLLFTFNLQLSSHGLAAFCRAATQVAISRPATRQASSSRGCSP